MPSGTPSGKGLYLTVYPLSRPNTDTVQTTQKTEPVYRIQYTVHQSQYRVFSKQYAEHRVFSKQYAEHRVISKQYAEHRVFSKQYAEHRAHFSVQ